MFTSGPITTFTPDEIYRNRFIIAITVTLASVLELLDTSIVNVAIPHMMGNLGATLDEIAWVSTGYVVANVIVLPISGWLSDNFGRQRYFAASIILFTVASFFCGSADSLQSLVFWRILQGIGGGGLLSTAQATLYDVFPPKEVGISMAIFGMGVMVGPTLGPTVGGYITDAYSWHWIFYINVPLGIIALLMTLAYVPDSEHAERAARVDFLGLLLLAVGVGCLQTMLERGEGQGWFDSREIITYAIVSASSLIAFVFHELAVDHPIVNIRILKDRQFAAGVAYAFLLGTALYSTVFIFPVYLQTLQGFDAWQTGLMILPGALASGITMGIMGPLMGKVQRLDPRLMIVCGVGIFGLSMWKHGHFTTLSGMPDYFWPLILRGVGLGMIFLPLNALAMANLQPRNIGGGSGVFNLTRQLGGSVGIALSATFLTRFQTMNRADLLQHVTQYSDATNSRLDVLERLTGGDVQAALKLLSRQIQSQAMMLSFEQLFLLFGVGMAIGLPLLLFMTERSKRFSVADAH